MLKNLCMSKKNCTFASQIAKTVETMAQETLNSLIQVMFTLSLSEQKRVIAAMQENVQRLSNQLVEESIRKQLIASAEAGVAEIERGECYTNKEVLERMNERVERAYEAAI